MTHNISIIGLGKLGTPMLAIFASKGYRVVGVDVDPQKVQRINARVSPVDEPGVGKLLRSGAPGTPFVTPWIEATTDLAYAVRSTDVTFIVTATPSEPSGRFSLQHVLGACDEIGQELRKKEKFHIVVITSTVMPGDTWGPIRVALERASGKSAGVHFGLCYNPEFIALGTVVRDFQNPDFVLIGQSDPQSGATLAEVYEHVCDNRPGITRMNLVNAEITKLALNTYVTTKITYANMLAGICEKIPGANVDVVSQAIGLDTRIGSKCLKGAVPYGGPCFPRDNRALINVADDLGVQSHLAKATDVFNRGMIERFADLVQSFGKRNVGILGKSYKLGTEITDESAGIKLRTELICRNVNTVRIDGPSTNALEVVKSSDVIIVTMPYPEFLALPYDVWKDKIVIDCWRALSHLDGQEGITYIPLGVGR